jgi:hypothetical protein
MIDGGDPDGSFKKKNEKNQIFTFSNILMYQGVQV